MVEIVGYLIAFVAGTAAGAAGQYFGSKYTDRRQAKEQQNSFDKQFRKVRELMPELFEEMKKDFSSPSGATIRELVVLPTEGVLFNSGKPRFIYFEDTHENLQGKVDILEQGGFLSDVTPGNTPIYRISEEFHEAIQEML